MSKARKDLDRYATGAWAIELLPGIGKFDCSAWVRIKIPDDEAREKHALPHVHGSALAKALEECRRQMIAEASEIGSDDYHAAINAAEVALRAAGRLP